MKGEDISDENAEYHQYKLKSPANQKTYISIIPPNQVHNYNLKSKLAEKTGISPDAKVTVGFIDLAVLQEFNNMLMAGKIDTIFLSTPSIEDKYIYVKKFS